MSPLVFPSSGRPPRIMEFRRRSSVPGNGEPSRDDDGAARPDGVARPAGIGVPAADRGFEDEALSFIDSLYGTALKLTRRGAAAPMPG